MALKFNFETTKAQISIAPVISIKAGEKGIISLKVIDAENKIAKISITPREHTEYAFELNDNGETGDGYADDGVWSMEIEVPYDAPADIYYLDCEFYGSDGSPVMTKSKTGESTKLTYTILLKT